MPCHEVLQKHEAIAAIMYYASFAVVRMAITVLLRGYAAYFLRRLMPARFYAAEITILCIAKTAVHSM